MTQEELGAKVGVQKAVICKYENGLFVNLKRSVIEKLALALDTTPTYLMDMEDNNVSDSLSSERSAILSMLREAGARDEARISEMIKDFQKLNEDGKERAVERIHELTEIERFQNLRAIAFESYKEKHKK